MRTQIHRLFLVLAAASALGACTMGHRIQAPADPIRIEMQVLLKHEHTIRTASATD